MCMGTSRSIVTVSLRLMPSVYTDGVVPHMPWHRLSRRPTGSPDGAKPLASAKFEKELGPRTQVYLMPAHPEYTQSSLRPGFSVHWSFKEPGQRWKNSTDDAFCTWPAELTVALTALILEAGERAIAEGRGCRET